MLGSMILGIAGQVRARIAAGEAVCNLTVGDFDPRQFPIPGLLRDATVAGYDGHQTSYPPPEGIPELRAAVVDWYRRDLDLEFGPDWVVVASGARPVMYATFRLFLEPGDTLLCCVPSWNNGYYAQLCGARLVALRTRSEDNFFPTVELLRPHLATARVFALNSPLNPTGTMIAPERLAEIAAAIADENDRRIAAGVPPLMWMWDQVYWRLRHGSTPHVHPCALVPRVTPWVITVDAVSKAFAATGLRVGWAVLPPPLADRMKALVGHIGAWAPRPEQAGTARLLRDAGAIAAYEREFHEAVTTRLGILDRGLTALGVEHLVPEGAIYLSVRFELFGRPGVDGAPMATNEDVRRWLLARAGIAVVPFQAFDLEEETGWFRISVGAVSVPELEAALARLGEALATVR